MSTECIQKSFEFHPHFQRKVESDFAGGQITSHGGGIFLREVDRKIGLLKRLAGCFRDRRDPERIEHDGFLSEYTVLLWATRILTITMIFAAIRCLPYLRAKRMWRDGNVVANRIEARHWPAKVP